MESKDEYILAIKQAAFNLVLSAVMKNLITSIPFFGLGFPGMILKFFVTKILTVAFNAIEMGTFFLYIDLRTNNQAKDFEKAALENAKAQLTGTEYEKQKAEQTLIDSFKQLAKFHS